MLDRAETQLQSVGIGRWQELDNMAWELVHNWSELVYRRLFSHIALWLCLCLPTLVECKPYLWEVFVMRPVSTSRPVLDLVALLVTPTGHAVFYVCTPTVSPRCSFTAVYAGGDTDSFLCAHIDLESARCIRVKNLRFNLALHVLHTEVVLFSI